MMIRDIDNTIPGWVPKRHELWHVLQSVDSDDLFCEVCGWLVQNASTLLMILDAIGDWCTIITYANKNMLAIELLVSVGISISSIFDSAKMVGARKIIPIANFQYDLGAQNGHISFVSWNGPHFSIVTE